MHLVTCLHLFIYPSESMLLQIQLDVRMCTLVKLDKQKIQVFFNNVKDPKNVHFPKSPLYVYGTFHAEQNPLYFYHCKKRKKIYKCQWTFHCS